MYHQTNFNRLRIGVSALSLSVGLAACGSSTPEPLSARDAVGRVAFTFRVAGDTLRAIGRAVTRGDSARVILVRPTTRDNETARLCGYLVSRSPIPLRLPSPSATDSEAPRLLVSFTESPDVIGVRYVVAGQASRYVFEGITRDGRQRVTMQVPVRTPEGIRVPKDAPAAAIESALRPRPTGLDSLFSSLRIAFGRPTGANATPIPSAMPDSAAAIDDAVPLAHELPLTALSRIDACPASSFALLTAARIDQRVRVPLVQGDTLTVRAFPVDGVVDLSFDEDAASATREPAPVPPTPEMSGSRVNAPPRRGPAALATFVARATGNATIRIRLNVTPRVQAGEQFVLLSTHVKSATPPR
jgi:hypothetical protein